MRRFFARALPLGLFFSEGGAVLRCGAKCFLVEIEVKGDKEIKSVNARTPVEARKTIRNEYGRDVEIISVIEANKN